MAEMPIWKAVLKMALPALLFMLLFGSFFFVDMILAINLAPGNMTKINGITDKQMVLLSMSSFGPINPLINSITLMFGMGIATRVSINLGRKRFDRAKNTLKTGTMVSMITSVLLTIVLMFVMKPWMMSQMPSSIAAAIADNASKYGYIIIAITPIFMFNQIISSTLRVEGRNRELMIPYIISIGINLFLDWVFMGPLGMGIEGGAIATMISTLFVTVTYLAMIIRSKDSIVKFKNMFGLKFQWIVLIGIILVGIAPFFRNLAQSITSTVEANVIKEISKNIYTSVNGDKQMTLMLAGAGPIFMLFFPLIFGFAQAGRPIASFNYGAKNYRRVKQTYIWIMIYSTITSILIYFISAFWLSGTLMDWLGVAGGATKPKSIKMLKIMMISIVLFGIVIATMVLTGSTDRILLSLFVSLLRGFILFFPMIYIFRALALSNTSSEYLFDDSFLLLLVYHLLFQLVYLDEFYTQWRQRILSLLKIDWQKCIKSVALITKNNFGIS